MESYLEIYHQTSINAETNKKTQQHTNENKKKQIKNSYTNLESYQQDHWADPRPTLSNRNRNFCSLERNSLEQSKFARDSRKSAFDMNYFADANYCYATNAFHAVVKVEFSSNFYHVFVFLLALQKHSRE